MAGFEFTFESWIVAGLGFVIALCLWWIYFDLADTSVVGRGVLGLVYVYGHFLLLAGVAAFGVGTKLAITEAAQPGLGAGTRWALAGGVAAFALSLAAMHIGAEWTSMRDRTFLGRIGLAALTLTLAAAGGALAPVGFVAVVCDRGARATAPRGVHRPGRSRDDLGSREGRTPPRNGAAETQPSGHKQELRVDRKGGALTA